MRLILTTLLATTQATWDEKLKCWRGPTSRYDGNIAVTQSGKVCQEWNKEEPHAPKHRPKGDNSNHCRNPDLDLAGPWCYTMDPETRWEYCNVTACSDESSYIIWTNFDADHQSSHLVQVHANPEVVRDQTDQSGSFNVQAITMTNSTLTEYWALAADYKNKQIYWTDYRAEHIGKFDWNTNKTENNLYQGMAHGIENLAVDYITGNLYWTDSDYKWIMVANKEFKHYTQIYTANDDADGPPYGLAIHSTKQMIFWSTYKIMGATIKSADLTANNNDPTNHNKVVTFPNVHDVTGLTIDYVDDRIYWTDFLGAAAVISSATLDGKHLINHFHRTGSVFWGVACYDHYLYVSDIYPKFMQDGKKYMLWVVTKLYIDPDYESEELRVPETSLTNPANEQKSFRYSITGRPRGVAVYSEYASPEKETTNPCEKDTYGMNGGCDHICIPKDNAGSDGRHRVCKCSIGYTIKKAQQMGCYADIQTPPYLVFADVDHRLIFQMSLKNESLTDPALLSKITYNVVPSSKAMSIHALCIDPVKKKIYYADKDSKKIWARNIFTQEETIHEETEELIHEGVLAQSCVVDTEGNNIFFVEGETRNIQVVSTSPDSSVSKMAFTVFKADSSEDPDAPTPNIQNIAIDENAKRVYWTDPTLTEGQGKISSSNMDGSDYRILIKDLQWPQGLKIYNAGTNALFFTEAMSGIIFKVPLGAISKIAKESPIVGSVNLRSTPGVVAYNISDASVREKQFHMDLALHGDYLYFTDLKHNAVERFNVKEYTPEKPNLKIETYGPSDFYSVVYMYAVGKNTLEREYDHSDCIRCDELNQICIPMLTKENKSTAKCVCGDGFEMTEDGECIEVELLTEYIIDNCPTDSQQSAKLCDKTVYHELFVPKISRNGYELPLADFAITKTLIHLGDPPKTVTNLDQIDLASGTNLIRYEFTDNKFSTKVSCQYSIQSIVHTCKAFDVTKLNPELKVVSDGCNCHEDGTDCNASTERQVLDTRLNVMCTDPNKRIQPYIGKETIQEKYPDLNVESRTVNSDDCSIDKADSPDCDIVGKIFPAKSMYFKCAPTSEEFQGPFNAMNDQTIDYKCVDIKSPVPINSGVLPTKGTKADIPEEVTSKKEGESSIVDDSIDFDKQESKGKGGIAAVVIIVLIIAAVVGIIAFKKMRTDYDGGFSFKGIFSRGPDPTAELEVPNSSTPYAAM